MKRSAFPGSDGLLASLACASVLLLASSALAAQPWKSVEERAQHDARVFNDTAAQFIEGPTVAVHAVAQGKQVVYVLTVKREPPFTPDTMDQFKAQYDSMVLGIACRGNAKDEDFSNGLSYITVFRDEHGQRLHELVLDRFACDRL